MDSPDFETLTLTVGSHTLTRPSCDTDEISVQAPDNPAKNSAKDAPWQGELRLPPKPKGLVVFVSPYESHKATGYGNIGEQLLQAGYAVLHIDLLDASSSRHADAVWHIPDLTRKLLTLLSHLHQLVEYQVMPPLPVALVASGEATPAAVRASAIRDEEVSVLVCQGGLVDLAGLQYLKILRAPLLFLHPAESTSLTFREADHIARAKQFIGSHVEHAGLPENPELAAKENARLILDWIKRRLPDAPRLPQKNPRTARPSITHDTAPGSDTP